MFSGYLDSFILSFVLSLNWIGQMIVCDVPWTQNYFWGLIFISIFVGSLEYFFPWRKTQSFLRKDFFLDTFYMFFNFFIFTVLITGFYQIISKLFIANGMNFQFLEISLFKSLPSWAQLVFFFIALDFVQWLTHITLHYFKPLWKYHRVHHSVKEMGFAAHLRYHWMENILYKPAKFLILMMVGGFEPESAYIVHFIAITIGHLNHANIKLSYGSFKYIFNNPVMHLHHHAYDLPPKSFGKNFGISLSIWDYLFRTNHIPNSDGYTKLGFRGDEDFPKSFAGQNKIL